MFDRAKAFLIGIVGMVLGIPFASAPLSLSLMPDIRSNKVGTGALGGGGKKSLGEIILFVLILFIVFLFATSGIIANSNIQTQLKNGAYYGGLFASVVVILIVLAFIL